MGIQDEADYVRRVDYIHFNPVKHGYVERASERPYSSIQPCIAVRTLDPHWGGYVPDKDKDNFEKGERRCRGSLSTLPRLSV